MIPDTAGRAGAGPRRRTPRAPAAFAAILCGALLAACSGAAQDDPPDAASPGPGEYLPGRSAKIDPAADPKAVVVLVPGGGWAEVDPTGFAPLAGELAAAGFTVVTVTYGTASTGVTFPRPVDDVACAVAFAAEQAPDLPVVLVGHSAGAHLALMAGLVPDRDDPECPYPPRAADAVVGLAGPYDVSSTGGHGQDLFGVPESEDPELWREGNPLTWVDERPDLPILLAHGDADSIVPLWFTRDMAEALEGGGHPVTTEVLAGQEHNDLFRPEVIADLLVAWVLRTVVVEAPAPV